MNIFESFYRLFILIASYQCCLGTPLRYYEIILSSVDILGVPNEFKDVKLRKSASTAVSCRFDIIFPQSNNVTNGPFTPEQAEITFLYRKRLLFGVFKGINSWTIYGFNFETESSLQLFFWSLRYYQPQPESYSLTTAILRYSRNRPDNLHAMTQGCEFHVQEFRNPGFNWKSFNFTKLTNDGDGTREGVLVFVPQTFSISQPLGRTKFAICHDDLPNEVFIVIFANPSSGTRFFNEVKDLQNENSKNSCEFPNLTEEQKNYLARLNEEPEEVIESIVLE